MRTLFAVTLMALFISASLSGQSLFTQREQEEIGKIVSARLETNYGLVVSSNVMHDLGNETNRAAFGRVFFAGINASYDCHLALKYLQHADAEAFAVVPRSQVVATGIQYVDSCNRKVEEFASFLISTGNEVGDPSMVATGERLQAVVVLSGFDSTLPFTEWRVASYPRVVGPHGDYDRSQFELQATDEEFCEVVKNAIALYAGAALWPDSARFGIREVLRYGASALDTLTQVRTLNGGMEFQFSDRTAIDTDTAAGSGLRPREFFRLLREVEHLNSPDTHTEGLARTLDGGLTGVLEVMHDGFVRAVSEATGANPVEEVRRWWGYTSDVPFDQIDSASGAARDGLVDFSLGWEHMDAVNMAWMLFFHEIPAPPTSGQCPAGETCRPPLPLQVTCGAGTTLSGSECVANPCPTCPPPVECPTLTPVLDYLSDRIQPRCVPQE